MTPGPIKPPVSTRRDNREGRGDVDGEWLRTLEVEWAVQAIPAPFVTIGSFCIRTERPIFGSYGAER